MPQKVKTLDFTGQTIYAGIDVHKKSYNVTLMGENTFLKNFTQPPEGKVLAKFLKKNYPGAAYKIAYEAGFSGFCLHEQLTTLGIECMVVNPADIPTSDKEKKQKQDKRDSRKIARSLRGGDLEAIYVPGKEYQLDRSLLRTRYRIKANLTRAKNRVKSMLYYFGINWPQEFENQKGYWSGAFIKWLENVDLGSRSGNVALRTYLKEAHFLRQLLLDLTREINQLSKTDRYDKNVKLLISVPGIARLTAMILLTEIIEINRFQSFDELCTYVGIIPSMHSSGEKENIGPMTKRGNGYIKKALIESAWVAIRMDPALTMKYNELCMRMKGTKAIIRITRKLLRRIQHVLKHQIEYQIAVVS